MILAVCFQLKQLKKQTEKTSGLNGIRTHGPCDTSAMKTVGTVFLINILLVYENLVYQRS